MRNIVIGFIIAFIIQIGFSQKTIQVKFLDSISHETIPFLYVETLADSTGDFTNLDGVIRLKQKKSIQTFLLSHISYGNQYIQLDLGKDLTIYLSPSAIGIQEIVVADVRRDIEEMLTKVFKHLRKDNSVFQNKYAFYLETKHKGKRFEKIKAVFDAAYTHRDGILESNLMDGEFWFNPDSLFINLDMDSWLLGFDPFAKKSKDDNHYLLTNADKIKKKNQPVLLMECNNCPSGYELFHLENEQQSIKIIANLESKKVANYQVTIKPSSKLFFINLISEDTTKINNIDINYLYGLDGNLEKMVFKIQLNDKLNRSLDIAGFFNHVEYREEKKIYYFGQYRPSTLYEKILMDPDVNKYRIDTLFNNNQYNEFKINSSAGLWSNDENIRTYFFSKGTFNKEIRMWHIDRKLQLDQIQIASYHIENTFTKESPIFSPRITWIFSHNNKNGQWKSLPSIWSSSSKIDYFNTSNHTMLGMDMAFDLAEIARVNCKPTDQTSINQLYEENIYEISTNMSLAMEDRLPLKKLYDYNSDINKKWAIDNLKTAFIREIPTILKYPKHNSFADQFAKAAYDMHYQNDTLMSSNFSRLSIEMYLHLLENFGPKLNYKKKGSTHSLLADQYYLLQNKKEACIHFASALVIWPEANQAHPKKNLMSLCNPK